jgi:hypothetical protein
LHSVIDAAAAIAARWCLFFVVVVLLLLMLLNVLVCNHEIANQHEHIVGSDSHQQIWHDLEPAQHKKQARKTTIGCNLLSEL